MKSIVYIILSCYLIVGCSFFSRKKEISNIINEWEQKEIIFPTLLISDFNKQDSIFQTLLEYKYKILHFIDSSGCTPCKLTFYEWTQLTKEIQDFQKEIAIIYVIAVKDSVTMIKTNQWKQLHKFKIPIFYDTKHILNDTNQFIKDPIYQTFLLDHNNRVLVIGNPIYNTKIWNLYKKTITNI